jgi:hypothetical protein
LGNIDAFPAAPSRTVAFHGRHCPAGGYKLGVCRRPAQGTGFAFKESLLYLCALLPLFRNFIIENPSTSRRWPAVTEIGRLQPETHPREPINLRVVSTLA